MWLRVTAYEQITASTWPRTGALAARCEHVCGTLLSKEVRADLPGLYRLYATSNHQPTTNYADFDWFEYQPLVP